MKALLVYQAQSKQPESGYSRVVDNLGNEHWFRFVAVDVPDLETGLDLADAHNPNGDNFVNSVPVQQSRASRNRARARRNEV